MGCCTLMPAAASRSLRSSLGASGDISLAAGEQSNAFVVWSAVRAGTYLPTPVLYEGGLFALTETGHSQPL